MKTNVVSGNCPECNSTILFKKTPYVGQSTYCDNCNSELEVSQIDPLELEWAVGPGFMESNEQRFTKRRPRSKPSEDRRIDPKRSGKKKSRKRRAAKDDEWENQWQGEGKRSRKQRPIREEWADSEWADSE